MKNLMKSVAIVAGAIALSAGVASAQDETDRAAEIEAIVHAYAAALSASDTETLVSLYAPDGVFMPQYQSTQVGAEAVRATYERIFEMLSLDIEFEIAEILQVAPDWAFARTNSAGSTTINATGEKAQGHYQELFVFQRDDDGAWKIARYIFTTTDTPNQ